MTEQVGGIVLPAVPPDTDQSLDPALNVLALALPVILAAQAGDAYSSVDPAGAQIAQTVYFFDPVAVLDGGNVAVDDSALPALYLFSRTLGSTRLTDQHQEVEREIGILWLPQSRQNQENAAIDSFFAPFAAVIASLVERERHQSFVADDDQGDDPDPDINARKVAAQAFGSSVLDLCGFSRWTQLPKDAVTRTHFSIISPVGTTRYDGFLAKITGYEMTSRNPASSGYVPTALTATFNTGGDDPLTTGGFEKDAAT